MFSNKSFFLFFFSLIITWFVYQEIFFATHIKLGVSPDEIHHYTLSTLYYQSKNIPLLDSENTYRFGSVSTSPYLYHLIMGKFLYFNIFHFDSLIFLRFINIFLSLFTIYFSYQLIKQVTNNKIIQICFLIVQTNILMFVFLSGMVSYDNLINLLSVSSTFYLIKFINQQKRIYLLLILVITLIGALTKTTYLPLALIQLLILFFYLKRGINYASLLRRLSFKECLIIISIVFFTVIDFRFYLKNIINYHQLDPSPEKVVGIKNSRSYNLQFQRDEEALKTINERPLLSKKTFFRKYIYQTEGSIFGILAHINLIKNNVDLRPYNILIVFSLILFIFNIKSILKNKNFKILLIISVLYTAIVFIDNFRRYLTLHIFGLGLQGRYNFPVLPSLIIFFIYSLLYPFKDKLKLLITLLISIIFITGNFFWFVSNASSQWYI